MVSISDDSMLRPDLNGIGKQNAETISFQDAERSQFEPAIRMAVYALASFAFVIALTIATTKSNSHTILIPNYSHLSIPVLAVGLAVFPIRLTWLAFCVFFISFLLTELVAVGFENSSGWTAYGMLKSFPLALAVGFVAGAAAKSFFLVSKSTQKAGRSTERAALVAGGIVALVGIPLGCLALWADSHGKVSSEEFASYAIVLSQRMLRLALVTAAATLMLRALPKRSEALELFVQLLAYIGLGYANRKGIELTSYADPAVLGIALIFLRPIRPTVAASLAGICLFAALTGVYVDLPDVTSLDNLKFEQIANLLFVIIVLVAAMRIRSERIEKLQMKTLGRMARVQELARYGHFILDPANDTFRFDSLVQKNLKVPAEMHSFEFVQRVHPEDRDAIVAGIINTPAEGSSFSFRLTLDGPWVPGGDVRHFAGFAITEMSDGVAEITYGVFVDVTREHAKEAQMIRLVNELSERQGQQTQLFSIISHELRTPASILSLLLDEMEDGKNVHQTGQKMRGVLDQLLSILSDMRQTVRPEQNLPVRIEAFKPAALAQSVAEAFQPLAEAQGIALRTQIGPAGDAARSTDKVRLNQTLSNLVKNAILHSQATEIVVSFDCTDDDTGIWTVSDNGRNISVEQRERLFQPFVRSNSEGVRSDGSGLGLYIAKGAIELLGGTIAYQERPMSGAAFVIRIPMPLAQNEGVEAFESNEGSLDVSQLRVLLLEDSETMGEILSTRLARVFKSVKWLRDGAAGLEWLKSNDIDLVATDLYMPGMNGVDLAQRLRSEGFTKPIIGMTAAESGSDVDLFKSSGADAVLTKPIGPKELIAVLTQSQATAKTEELGLPSS